MATPEEIFARFKAAARAEAEKGMENPGEDAFANPDTDALDGQYTKAKRKRGGAKPEQRTESEIEQLVADIPDGASVTLRSPSGTPCIYFREGGEFYLESQRTKKSKTIQTGPFRKRLQSQGWVIDEVTPPGIEPVPPVTPGVQPQPADSKKDAKKKSRQWQERSEPLTEETKGFLLGILQLDSNQIDFVNGESVLNSYFTRLGNADFSDVSEAIRELRLLKQKYHPDANGNNSDEGIKILNKVSHWVKSSYEAYRPGTASQQETVEESERKAGTVRGAKTTDDLFAIVESFGKIYSSRYRKDIAASTWVGQMKAERAQASLFQTEAEYRASGWESTVTNTYGIRERFQELILEMIHAQERARSKEKEKKQPTREELAEVKNFDELFAVLEKYDGIQGSKEFYTPTLLRDIISNVRKGDRSIDFVTSSKGLKGVVERLLREEREPYVSGNVFAEQILAEQDARKGTDTHTDTRRSEREVNPGSPEAKETVSAHGLDEAEMRGRARRQASEEAVKKIDREIKSLEEKLDEARKVAAHAEYQNVGVWARLKQTLGVMKREADKTEEAVEYKNVINDLLKLKLDRLEAMKDNFTPHEFKKAMAGTLQSFRTESRFKFDDAYIETARESKGFLEKLEDIGRWYNKQSKWKKIGVGVVLATGAFFTGGSLGSLMIPILVKKAVGTAGLFATFDPMFEKALRDRLEKKIAKESENEVKESEETVISIDVLKLKLQKEIDELDQNFLRRKRERLARKASIALFAGAIGFGSTFFSHASEAAEAKDVAKGAGSAVKAVIENENPVPTTGGGAVAREQLDRALQGGVDGNTGVASAPTGVATEAAKAAVEAPVATVEASAVLEASAGDNIYEVSKGDTVDGLIGSYLSEHYSNFSGMSEGQKTHAINALERQLRHLSPEQLKAAGIGSGNIHNIQVKELVDFDKLFSAGDADKVMGKAAKISAEAVKNIEANNARIAEWASAHPGEPYLGQSLETTPSHAAPASHVMNTRGTVQLPPSSGTGVPADFVPSIESSTPTPGVLAESVRPPMSPAEASFEPPSLVEMRRGGDWFMQVFRVDDQAGGKDWVFDKKEILSTKMADILKVESNGTVSVVENTRFNPVQSENLQKFVTELPKTFPDGRATLTDFFRARPDISVGEYLARVAKVVPQGTRIGLYTTTN